MPKTIQGFLMAVFTTILVIAVITRVDALSKLAGLPPAPK